MSESASLVSFVYFIILLDLFIFTNKNEIKLLDGGYQVLPVRLVPLDSLEIQGYRALVEVLDLLDCKALSDQLEWWELLACRVIQVTKEILVRLVPKVHQDQEDRQDLMAVPAIEDSQDQSEQQVLDKQLLVVLSGQCSSVFRTYL